MESTAEWNKTIVGVERVKKTPYYDEPSKDSRYGFFQGRPIIGHDTKINGGVYLGGGEREALVVDDTKQPELLETYQELLNRQRAKEPKSGNFKSGILKETFELVKEVLPFNRLVVERLTSQYSPDQKVALSHFLNEEVGVCRHQALLTGYLLEKLVTEGILNGTVSVDRNYVPGQGGHAWVRYTNSAGEVAIIDPARDYFGPLKDASSEEWFYQRPSKFSTPVNKLSSLKNFFKR